MYKSLTKDVINAIYKDHQLGLDVDNEYLKTLINETKYKNIAGNINAMSAEGIDLTDVRAYEIEECFLRKVDMYTCKSAHGSALSNVIPLFYNRYSDVLLGLKLEDLGSIEMDDTLGSINDVELISQISTNAMEDVLTTCDHIDGSEATFTMNVYRPSHHHLLQKLFRLDSSYGYAETIPYRYFLNLIGFVDVIPEIRNAGNGTVNLVPVMSESMNESDMTYYTGSEVHVKLEDSLISELYEQYYDITED